MQPRNSSKNLPQPHSYMEDRNSSRASCWTPLAGQHDSPRVTGLWVWDVPESRGTQCPAPPASGWWQPPHCWALWNGPATCSAYRCFYSGQDSLISGRCQLQVTGSLPNLWSYLKSLSFCKSECLGNLFRTSLSIETLWGPRSSRLIVSGWYVPHGSPTHYHHNCFLLPWKWCFDTREGWQDHAVLALGFHNYRLWKGGCYQSSHRRTSEATPLRVRKFETYISQMRSAL